MGHIHKGDSKKDVCFSIEVGDINLPGEYVNVQMEFTLDIKSQLWQFYPKASKRILSFDTIQANYIWGGLRVKEFPHFNKFWYVLCHIYDLTRLGKEANGFGEEKMLRNLKVENTKKRGVFKKKKKS